MDPPLSLARLRTRGQLTELRAADLRFTPEETATFFQDVMGLVLSMSVEFYLHNAEQQLNTTAPENYQELLSELLVIRAYLQIYRGNFYTAIDFAQQANENQVQRT